MLFVFFSLCCRKVSRQEYLKKREEKKLEELRYACKIAFVFA